MSPFYVAAVDAEPNFAALCSSSIFKAVLLRVKWERLLDRTISPTYANTGAVDTSVN